MQTENASERKNLLPSFGTKALSGSAQRYCSSKRRLLRTTAVEKSPDWEGQRSLLPVGDRLITELLPRQERPSTPPHWPRLD